MPPAGAGRPYGSDKLLTQEDLAVYAEAGWGGTSWCPLWGRKRVSLGGWPHTAHPSALSPSLVFCLRPPFAARKCPAVPSTSLPCPQAGDKRVHIVPKTTGALLFLLRMQKENTSVRVKAGAPNLKNVMENIAVDLEISMNLTRERALYQSECLCPWE